MSQRDGSCCSGNPESRIGCQEQEPIGSGVQEEGWLPSLEMAGNATIGCLPQCASNVPFINRPDADNAFRRGS